MGMPVHPDAMKNVDTTFPAFTSSRAGLLHLHRDRRHRREQLHEPLSGEERSGSTSPPLHRMSRRRMPCHRSSRVLFHAQPRPQPLVASKMALLLTIELGTERD
jgi:hypothetical protein